jgi:hypothetical protein
MLDLGTDVTLLNKLKFVLLPDAISSQAKLEMLVSSYPESAFLRHKQKRTGENHASSNPLEVRKSLSKE